MPRNIGAKSVTEPDYVVADPGPVPEVLDSVLLFVGGHGCEANVDVPLQKVLLALILVKEL